MAKKKLSFQERLKNALDEKAKAFEKNSVREGNTIIALPPHRVKTPVLVKLATLILRGYGCRMQTQYHDLDKK